MNSNQRFGNFKNFCLVLPIYLAEDTHTELPNECLNLQSLNLVDGTAGVRGETTSPTSP